MGPGRRQVPGRDDRSARVALRWAERRGFEVELDEVLAGFGGQDPPRRRSTSVRGALRLRPLEAAEARRPPVSCACRTFDAQHRRQTSFAYGLRRHPVPRGPRRGEHRRTRPSHRHLPIFRCGRPARERHRLGGPHHAHSERHRRVVPERAEPASEQERRPLQIPRGQARRARQTAERRAALNAISGPQSDVAWGSQIRSYTLAPYQLVKDLRTEHETGNVEAVLDAAISTTSSPRICVGAGPASEPPVSPPGDTCPGQGGDSW